MIAQHFVMDQIGCLGCDIANGRMTVPGGVLFVSDRWLVNHCVGPFNIGTLVVAPRDHICRVADLDDAAVIESAFLLRAAARVVEELCDPEQVYVCLWSHGDGVRKHLHHVVQPVTTEVVAEFNGLRSEQLQARMMESNTVPEPAEVSAFCDLARAGLARQMA